MQQTNSPISPRIDVVDALRGFAVIAILLVHSVEHFIYPVYPDKTTLPEWLNILDSGVFSVTFTLFAGKAYAIFALLFGFTFHIQFTNQLQKGKDFGGRFLWRLLLLSLFATINAALFPGGDVLLLFVFVGIFLVIVRHWSNKVVFIIAIILLLQPVEWVHYIIYSFDNSHTLPELGVGSLYEEVIGNTKSGLWGPFLLGNITVGQKASLMWAVGGGRFLQTAGLFLLGLLIGRQELFIPLEQNLRFWTKTLIIAAILFGPLYQLKVELYDNASNVMSKNTVGVVFDMWQKFAFTFVLIASFVILYQRQSFIKLTSNLRLYGKMSLSNYITQSIIGALIFFPIGLNLAPYCGYTISLFIGFAIFFLQLTFCKWWFKTHSHGPFESIWRKLTWIRVK